ncbi:FAD-binding oxidoreductase [Terricaulis silvestris]|uniref:Putative FAD-linked oxidoreductase n=1 Tax=Terricaulis silvestris TaxID=2686094 RepID=A0A6I6MMQ8_9CAUL|nr:FAD-binding oxidoreductase [Terricaulis silvestris]QGZ94556.1 putative FAD-linked oxidoreductase [Terricaulis silvestris]
MSTLYEQLAARLGPKGFATDAETLAPFLTEWRGRYQGATPFLAMPASTEEVSDVVRLCAASGAAITPQGGNTGLVGGQIPDGEVLLSLKRMNRIRAVDPANDSLIAEAGVILSAVQNSARESDRLFPLSLASEGSATIGGLISTNAGGVHVLRYGMMRDLVLGIEAVLPDGRVFSGLKGLRKDNTGYDLKQLFIGAEGTLGVVTAACLKLFPRPRAHEVALVAVPSARAALDLLHRMKGATGAVAAFEIMNRLSVDLVVKNVADRRDPMPGAPFMVLIEFEAMNAAGLRDAIEGALAAAIDAGEAKNALIAENASQARGFWRIREDVSAGHRPEGAQVNHDVSVPVSQTPLFLERADAAMEASCPGARIVAFGHMGDGNFHYTAMQPVGMAPDQFPGEQLSQTVYTIADAMGGSISAEHGIGVARRADLARFKDPESIALMRAVKRALDPNNVMNPRALLP